MCGGSDSSADRLAASNLETTTSPTIPTSEIPARAEVGLVVKEVPAAGAWTMPDHQDLVLTTKRSSISKTQPSNHPAVARTVKSHTVTNEGSSQAEISLLCHTTAKLIESHSGETEYDAGPTTFLIRPPGSC